MDREDSSSRTRHRVLERLLLDASAEPTDLPLSLLQDITDRFSEDQEIGCGGFAVVYKGMVGNGRMVAVKKLSTLALMDEHKFHCEVECLTKAKHKNIVRFLGFCADSQGKIEDFEGRFVMADQRNWLLCFEYVPNGSLDKYITDASQGLGWRERYMIISGICDGLNYLHKRNILHLDLKPANILVDDHMVPKIADFGLSRCFAAEQTHASTLHMFGSMGYLAPESYDGKIAFTSDIYSLGVIIFEILTGKKGYSEDENVAESWMNRLEPSKEETQLEQIRVCTKIGLECLDRDPKKRPSTHDIIDRLNKTKGIDYCVETSMSTSSAEYINSVLKQRSQEKIGKRPADRTREDTKELPAGTEDLPKFLQTYREDEDEVEEEEHDEAEAEAAEGQLSPQDSQQGISISSSNSSVLYKLSNLDMFGRKARKNYVRNGGRILEKSQNLTMFRKKELEPILKSSNFIGRGGFDEVYRGILDNKLVAVRKPIRGRVKNKEEFANEIIMQSQIVHRNIVRLIGCCLDMDIPVLVYEFVSNGSLHDILHGNRKARLSLDARLRIASGSAEAIVYMHSSMFKACVLGGVKPGNILLDGNFVPKISDLGISRLRMIEEDDFFVSIIGDRSYMDPLYLQTGQLTEASDVYSFGVVILELITRKKATCSYGKSLVRDFLEDHKQGKKSTKLFDKEIAVTGNLEVLGSLAEIAVECLSHFVDQRPSMRDVAERLYILIRQVSSSSSTS